MLFTLGHGQHIVVEPPIRAFDAAREMAPAAAADVVPLAAVLETPVAVSNGNAARSMDAAPSVPAGGPFRYYFHAAPDLDHPSDIVAKLDTLANAMVEEPNDPTAENSVIPPIFTYLGQFIDHDITANTDREAGVSEIKDGADLTPLPRATVTQNLLNLRNGALELDSVYGDGPDQGVFSRKLARLMRHPTLKGKMRIGVPTASDDKRPPLPADPAADLLRLGRILGTDPAKAITVGELNALNPALRSNFIGADGQPIIQKAIIGDARNDENLIVAQLHCAILRFHNKVVDAAGAQAAGMSSDALFEWARQRVRWHYQWLVVNDYLPNVCDPTVATAVKVAGAPLYSAFFAAHANGSTKRMPMPLEFSVAGFRFGHSMVRAIYDHNRFFGTAEDGSDPFIPTGAPFDLLFSFTGNGSPPMPVAGGTGSHPTLPNNWIIEWDRFTQHDPAFPARSARKIDTHLAPPLDDLSNEPAGVFKHLARRNLRRGHRLNIPSAQDCITAINATNAAKITPLPASVLTHGVTGPAIYDGGFAAKTPLWFYILKEAEETAGGAHLGALGSTIVAETLTGLVVNDPSSYWHQSGSDAGRWHPRDSVKPGGQVVDSVRALLRAAGVL